MILCIETATKNCSVAIVSDSRVIAQSAQREDKFVHGERLHLLVQKCMQTAGLDYSDIQGVCVGKGPGSYTGLRIGVSAAKGICYAA
ncbi:MAG: tRNA (adenosine(37)-N6)-threonylcarbamoyltransferase complex dimerization subunit type 1 TsaB, partial [Schleiferiaceae bacterium]